MSDLGEDLTRRLASKAKSRTELVDSSPELEWHGRVRRSRIVSAEHQQDSGSSNGDMTSARTDAPKIRTGNNANKKEGQTPNQQRNLHHLDLSRSRSPKQRNSQNGKCVTSSVDVAELWPSMRQQRATKKRRREPKATKLQSLWEERDDDDVEGAQVDSWPATWREDGEPQKRRKQKRRPAPEEQWYAKAGEDEEAMTTRIRASIPEQSAVANIREYGIGSEKLVWIKTGKEYDPTCKVTFPWRPGYVLPPAEAEAEGLLPPVGGRKIIWVRVIDDNAFYPWNAPREVKESETAPYFGGKSRTKWDDKKRNSLRTALEKATKDNSHVDDAFYRIFEKGAKPALDAAFENDRAMGRDPDNADSPFSVPRGCDRRSQDPETTHSLQLANALGDTTDDDEDPTDNLRTKLIAAVGQRRFDGCVDLLLQPHLFSYRGARNIVAALPDPGLEREAHLADLTAALTALHREFSHSKVHLSILTTAKSTLGAILDSTLVRALRQKERGDR
eukprot:CAMPEP_0118901040 /NCGR_PEP_ID=MMETSP1166-20130328/6901_1 /TAXON_ID=1104430 /ORGANISM="Chrysoreinhardia sp, Strain CCMP3193" /LENGTH=502 /DNA_ID=CAMNT_0006840199 /DNA_START=1 /DNA_END=1509 /DNA_ORIENTATION=+